MAFFSAVLDFYEEKIKRKITYIEFSKNSNAFKVSGF